MTKYVGNDAAMMKFPAMQSEPMTNHDEAKNSKYKMEILKRKHPEESSSDDCYARSKVVSFNQKVVKAVERACGFWGFTVARNPTVAVIGSVLLVLFLGCGVIKIDLLFRPHDLWVPRNSEFYKVTQWMLKNFPSQYRNEIALWESKNILTAKSIQSLWELHLKVRNISVSVNDRSISYDNVCLQIASQYTPETYLMSEAMGGVNSVCYESSLLELFEYDEGVIYSLSDIQVVEAVNSINTSKHYGSPLDTSRYLGGVTKDEKGKILKATSTLQIWLTRIDNEAIAKGYFKLDIGTGEKIDIAGVQWENALIHLINDWNQRGYNINLNAGSTLGNVLYQSITDDALWLGAGWAVLLFYVILTLGRPMQPDQRIIPAIVGILAIGMAVLASYGVCSMIGVPYGTLTNVLPVLLVALGVDDMYVIVTAWDEIDIDNIGDLTKKAQLTMQRAGTAITVTSLTDVLAFVVGTTTSLPGLRYFCIYSVVGISFVFFLQGTLFVAAMVVKQRWTFAKKSSKNLEFDKKEFKILTFFNMGKIMKAWGSFLMQRYVKAIVITLTLALFLCSILHIPKMSREFDTFWLVPEKSELYKWHTAINKSFPHFNENGAVFFKGIHLPQELKILKNLTQNLRNVSEIIAVKAWFDDIDVDEMYEKHSWIKDVTPVVQCEMLIQHIGIEYLNYFNLNLNTTSSEIYVTEEDKGVHPCSSFKVEFQYNPPSTYEKQQRFMRLIRKIVSKTEVSGFKAAWAKKFVQWETDEILLGELIQNLCIVLSVVGLITLILLNSMRASLFVLVCVIFTIADVAFIVHLWGLSVNTLTMITYVLAVGICVNYSVHIAHDFLLTTGSRDERVVAALKHMGAAVLHGGCSTFLSFLLLAPSDSYIYISYFKILTGVSIFGLYHALVFLPVLLSLLGPESYPDNVCPTSSNDIVLMADPPLQNSESTSIYTIGLKSDTANLNCLSQISNPPGNHSRFQLVENVPSKYHLDNAVTLPTSNGEIVHENYSTKL